GLHDLRTPRTELVRDCRIPLPGGDEGRGRPSAPRDRRAAEVVPTADFPPGGPRMRVLRRHRGAAGPTRGARRGSAGPRQVGAPATDERARLWRAGPEERGPRRDPVRPDRPAVRDGGPRPRDEADEAHGAVKELGHRDGCATRRRVTRMLPRSRTPASKTIILYELNPHRGRDSERTLVLSSDDTARVRDRVDRDTVGGRCVVESLEPRRVP